MFSVELDHIGIPDVDRQLIQAAVNGSSRVYLAPMDKGLSGSSVWQARWLLEDGSLSRLNVFKIGKLQKITREHEAMTRVASAVADMPAYFIHQDKSAERALLQLQFQGSITAENSAFSFRNYIRKPNYKSDSRSVADVVNNFTRTECARGTL